MNLPLKILVEIITPFFFWAFVTAILFSIYLSLSIRRGEKAKLFLDLLESGLKQGQSPEQTIVSISRCHDYALGVHFYLVAAHIENGLRLVQALDKASPFLPKQIIAMLRVGEETGTMDKIIPACRKLLYDTRSRTIRENVFLSPSLGLIPVGAGIFVVIAIAVIPKLREILYEISVPLPPATAFLFQHTDALQNLFIAWSAFIFLIYFKSALPRWVNHLLTPIHEWLALRSPWRHTRIQRDFSTMFALLLDAGVPEDKAVLLAGSSVSNRFFLQRAARVAQKLQTGVKLPEALAQMDRCGEFHWRLKNALHESSGFLQALRGWLEALDARAFRQELSAVHFTASLLVVINGLFVGLITVGIFQIFVAIINEGVLW
jgi:type IV pilus assembly protein PilC